MSDFKLVTHGSICILNPISPVAIEWCNEHLPENAQRWGVNGYVIEHRYVADIVHGIEGADLVTEIERGT